MQMSEVDLLSPQFADHPPGWQSAADIFEAFTLAWALELKERNRRSPGNPMAPGLVETLPVMYGHDTLGHLITLSPGSDAASFARAPVARLTVLRAAWSLFDHLNGRWQLQPQDFSKMASAMAYVTGGSDRQSAYGSKSATYGKCLLAVRVRRAFQQESELDLTEEWFVTGDQELTFTDARGNDSLLFHFGPQPIPIGIFAHEFVDSVWSTAQVLVDELGADWVISRYRHRLDELLDILTRGGEEAERARRWMSPAEFRYRNGWPGWA